MTKATTLQIRSLDELPAAAQKFVSLMGDYTVFAFQGPMGVGKTTFISQLCRALGVDCDQASSPSFSIINEYRSDTTAELIYHFDCYRLESVAEAEDIGAEDYFYCGAICLIEWPERILDLLPDDTVSVVMAENGDGTRTMTITFPQP